MDGVSSYNKIDIHQEDQNKMTFTCPWGNFSYWKFPFRSKNVGATFQQAISYTFYDIKHIVQSYFD